MREFKFRQWTTGWSSGKNRMIYLGDINDEEFSSLTQGDLMQFTGLFDSNGGEIYEGDILRDEFGIGEVKWLPEQCAFVVRTTTPTHAYHSLISDGKLERTEVVGNVYENPTLLNKLNEGEESE